MLFQRGPIPDIIRLYGVCEGISAQYRPEHKTTISRNSIEGVIFSLYRDFPHDEGMDKASPFKKAAAFLCDWIVAKPIAMEPEPYRHMNTRIGLFLVLDWLEGASLTMNNTRKVISKPLMLSRHSLDDIVDALHHTTPITGFKLTSVLP